MPTATWTRGQLWDKIVEQAQNNPKYMQQLKADPRGLMEKHACGVEYRDTEPLIEVPAQPNAHVPRRELRRIGFAHRRARLAKEVALDWMSQWGQGDHVE